MRANTQAKERLQPKPRGSRLGHRLKNIETLLSYRREYGFPEADELDVLDLAFNAIAHDPVSQLTNRVQTMIAWGTKFFPTIDRMLLEQLAIGSLPSFCPYSNERAADLIDLDLETRRLLDIRMIGAIGYTTSDLKKQAEGRKRIRNRERNASNRKGKVTPLDERRKSSVRAQADRLGISRSTFYYRLKKEKEKAEQDKMSAKIATVSDTCVSPIIQQEITNTGYSYSDTQLALFFRTTDRTIRRWRKNGKLEERLSQVRLPGQPLGFAGAVRTGTDQVAGSARVKRAGVRHFEPAANEAEPAIRGNARAEENETGRTVSDPPRLPSIQSSTLDTIVKSPIHSNVAPALKSASRLINRVHEVAGQVREAYVRGRAAIG